MFYESCLGYLHYRLPARPFFLFAGIRQAWPHALSPPACRELKVVKKRQGGLNVVAAFYKNGGCFMMLYQTSCRKRAVFPDE